VTIAGIIASSRYDRVQKLFMVAIKPHMITDIDEFNDYIHIFEIGSRYAIGSGMIGTLIGIILMLGNMSDVASIGPNMAVALITALYGIILSEFVLQPIKNWLITISPLVEKGEKHKYLKRSNAGWHVYVLGAFIPLIAFFILLLTMSTSEIEEDPIDKRITQFSISQFSISFGNDIKAAEKKNEWIGYEIKGLMKWPIVVGNEEFNLEFNFNDYVNKNEVELGLYIEHKNDSANIENFTSFSYPIPIGESRDIVFERNGYHVSFRANAMGTNSAEK
jgi:hypothetical protein